MLNVKLISIKNKYVFLNCVLDAAHKIYLSNIYINN